MRLKIIIWYYTLLNKWFKYKPKELFTKLISCNNLIFSDIITRDEFINYVWLMDQDLHDDGKNSLLWLFKLHTIYDEIINDIVYVDSLNNIIWSYNGKDINLGNIGFNLMLGSMSTKRFVNELVQTVYFGKLDKKFKVMKTYNHRREVFKDVILVNNKILDNICRVEFLDETVDKFYRRIYLHIENNYRMKICYDDLPTNLNIMFENIYKRVNPNGNDHKIDISDIMRTTIDSNELKTSNEYLTDLLTRSIYLLMMDWYFMDTGKVLNLDANSIKVHLQNKSFTTQKFN